MFDQVVILQEEIRSLSLLRLKEKEGISFFSQSFSHWNAHASQLNLIKDVQAKIFFNIDVLHTFALVRQ